MKKSRLFKIQTVVFCILGILMAVLMAVLAFNENVEVKQTRHNEEVTKVQDVVRQEIEKPDAPEGMEVEYRFTLNENMKSDTHLAFYSHHQYVDVELDGENIYSLRPTNMLSIKTVGSNWAMIPIYREDAGKEVCVITTPTYENAKDQTLEFYLGPSLNIYKLQLSKVMPEMTLSLMNVLIGFGLMIFAAYCLFKKYGGWEIFALGMLAVVMGIWRMTYDEFAAFLIPGRPVLIYYISLISLMLCPILLIKSITGNMLVKGRRVLDIACIAVAVISSVQLLLQIFGVMDLRENLKVTHFMIIVAAILIFTSAILGKFSNKDNKEEKKAKNPVWLIGVGIFMDLIFYYVDDIFKGLLFTLFFILCYVLIEGIRMGIRYVEHKNLLAEKEVQLAQSRFTTMMSQVRSHFIFNVLNAISGMCKYDPQKADETVVTFARYLRSNIDIMQDDDPVTFHADLRHLEDYIELEQIRFGERIKFVTDITVENFMVPPLILQPLVENSIKHGLNTKPEGGTITLRTRSTKDEIKIIIEDDGVGFDTNAGTDAHSVGLKNVVFRLEHMMNGRVEIESEIGRGTCVTVSIPQKEAEICM